MLIDILFLFGLAATVAVAAVLLCKHAVVSGGYLLVGGVGVLSLALSACSAFPFLVDVGQHNFIYTAMGYAAGRGLPPENPFAAGMPPNFPWVTFAIYTELAQLLGSSPGWIAKITGFICSMVAVWAVCVLVKTWSPSGFQASGISVAAVALALLAGTIFWGSFPKLGINPSAQPLFGGWWESRGIPTLTCFQKPTFPLGLASSLVAYATFVLGAIRGVTFGRGLVIVISAATSALYPFAWMGLGVAVAGASVAAWILRSSINNLLRSLCLAGVGGLIGYLHLKSLRPPGSRSAMSVDLSPGEVFFEIRLLLLYQGVLLLLCFFNWKFFREQWTKKQRLPFLLVGSVVALNSVALVVRFLDHTDYKLWVFCTIFLAILAAPTLYHGVRRAPLSATLVLTLLMFPLSRSIWQGSLALRKITPPFEVVVDHGQLLMADPIRQAPFDWLASEVPEDAVVIERGTTWSPVFANRSLFIGRHDLDSPEQLFGFLNPIHVWLADYCGFGEEFVAGRLELIDKVYSGQGGLEALKEAAKQVPERSIYVLGKSEQEMEALELLASQGALTEAANGDGWGIWEVTLEATP
jgi:hypothetical protein